MSSAVEQVMARVMVVLQTVASLGFVYRGRPEAFDEHELPASNLLRGSTDHEPLGGRLDVVDLSFELRIVRKALPAWETQTWDALTDAALALAEDATLAAQVRSLRLVRTESDTESAGVGAGQLIATFRAVAAVRRSTGAAV